jgi:UDP-glucuronate 4-epimerase
MKALVTGVGGFIGSHLAEALVADGHEVRGVDCFTDYYDTKVKRANIAHMLAAGDMDLVEADLRSAEMGPLLSDVDVVFHQAAQPGVRLSWSSGFQAYVEHNVLVTQRLLEALRVSNAVRMVFASSSSVYGNAPSYPTQESDLPRPHSPYGVTKLAAEHLCGLYAANWDVRTVSLRYFTVYGPRQRPDMAFHRFIESSLDGQEIPLFGTGEQTRDFSYVADVVRANVAAATAEVPPGCVLNVAGGSPVSMNQLIALLAELLDRNIRVGRLPPQAGDVERTGASTARATEMLGWEPTTDLRTGLAEQVTWHLARRTAPAPVPPSG